MYTVREDDSGAVDLIDLIGVTAVGGGSTSNVAIVSITPTPEGRANSRKSAGTDSADVAGRIVVRPGGAVVLSAGGGGVKKEVFMKQKKIQNKLC